MAMLKIGSRVYAQPNMDDINLRDLLRFDVVVKKEESVLRSVLMQKVASRGINKDRLDRALETLLAEESIEDHSEMGRGNKPRVWYTWEGGG